MTYSAVKLNDRMTCRPVNFPKGYAVGLAEPYGVSLKAKQRFFFQDELEYVSHTVGKGQVHVN